MSAIANPDVLGRFIITTLTFEELASLDGKELGAANSPYAVIGLTAVLCVFGIFLVPDMAAAMRELWRFVRPGGKLAITSWGRNVLEPANSVFWRSVRELRSELHKPSEPWDRIADPADLRQLRKSG